jgi:glutamine synthetase
MSATVQRPATRDDLLARLEADGIERLWVVYHDYLGRPGAKIIPRASFRSVVNGGVVFAHANLDFDHQDHQAEGATFLADSGDFLAVPDPLSYARLPQFPGTALVNAHMRTDEGEPWDGCPRTRLEAIVETLRDRGYSVMVALEPEFYLLRRTGPTEFEPANTEPMYSASGLSVESAVLERILEILLGMGIEVPQLGKEYSHGQYELSTMHGDPLLAIDSYYAVRQAVRDAANEFSYAATFMPKPYAEWAGNSLHVHLSLWDSEGTTDLTPEAADSTSISALGRAFAGGILDHIEALTGLASPTVNSYKRLQPGSWAPAHAFWGYGNRSGVIRVPGSGKRRHLEFRAGDNSAQPEVFLTGLIAAGLDGIERNLDPGEPFAADAGHVDPTATGNIRLLPRSLTPALDALERDEVIADALGEIVLSHTLTLRRHELAQYQLHVHPWERAMYGAIL